MIEINFKFVSYKRYLLKTIYFGYIYVKFQSFLFFKNYASFFKNSTMYVHCYALNCVVRTNSVYVLHVAQFSLFEKGSNLKYKVSLLE